MWDDDVLTEDELRDVMSQVVKALPSAPVEDQEKAIRSCMYNFEGERQAAMGNMTSKAVMIKAVRAAVSLLGCDGANSAEDFQQINKAVNYAEMAFDQMQMHADLKVVNGDSANAALEKVMGMLGGNPAAIEAAKKAAAAAIQGTLATGEDAEAAQRNAIAAQLGRNADMLSQLANGGQNTDELADELGISSMSRQELIMLCSAQREEVVNIREQNDELWAKMSELETMLETAKAHGGIAAAKAKPGGLEEQLEQMAAFANNLQEQLAITEKERDSANAKARIASLASAVKAKKAVDNYKANPTGAGADDSKACTVQ